MNIAFHYPGDLTYRFDNASRASVGTGHRRRLPPWARGDDAVVRSHPGGSLMPSRVLREGYLDSDLLSAVSDGAETLYVRLILAVDDYGRFDGRPSYIRVRCYPLRDVSVAV